MNTVLFHSTIFGPIHSRRLGSSLGINLLPNDGKICSFDCVYCEAGWNAQGAGTTGFPSRRDVASLLEEKLREIAETNQPLDVITFSGNGEPTLHPEFAEIIDDVIALRNFFAPQAKVSVLSNSTRINIPKVAEALLKIDNNILKLDSAITATLRLINQPNSHEFTAERVIKELKAFKNKCVIQTLLLRGFHNGNNFDNTTNEEISALLEAYKAIQPSYVMLYPTDRKTPAEKVEKLSHDEVASIASRIRSAGIKVENY